MHSNNSIYIVRSLLILILIAYIIIYTTLHPATTICECMHVYNCITYDVYNKIILYIYIRIMIYIYIYINDYVTIAGVDT